MQRRELVGRIRDPVVTAFDFLPVDVGFDLLLVPGELLLAHRQAPNWVPIEHQGSPRRPRPGYQRSGLPRATQPGAAADPHRADEPAATRGRGRGPPGQWARRIGVQHHGDRADSQAASLGTPGRRGQPSGRVPGRGRVPAVSAPGWRPGGPGEPAMVIAIDTGRTGDLRADGWLEQRAPGQRQHRPARRIPSPERGRLSGQCGRPSHVRPRVHPAGRAGRGPQGLPGGGQ